MRSYRLSRVIVVILLLSTSVSSSTRMFNGPTIEAAAGTFRANEICVDFVASLSAGEFFDGLQRVQVGSVVSFRKHNLLVKEFPDRITLEIKAGVRRCDRPTGAPIDPTIGSDLMRSLEFRAEWSHGKDSRNAQITSINSSRPSLQEMRNIWDYVITIDSHEVQITDNLVISMSSVNGNLQRRFVVSLTDTPTH